MDSKVTRCEQNQNFTKWIHALKMSASEVNWIHTWITGEPNSWFRNMAHMEKAL